MPVRTFRCQGLPHGLGRSRPQRYSTTTSQSRTSPRASCQTLRSLTSLDWFLTEGKSSRAYLSRLQCLRSECSSSTLASSLSASRAT